MREGEVGHALPDRPELLADGPVERELGHDAGADLGLPAFVERVYEGLFAREVVVDRARGDACPLGYRGDRRAVEPPLDEQVEGSLEDRLGLVVFVSHRAG